jgi:hypothetical protein
MAGLPADGHDGWHDIAGCELGSHGLTVENEPMIELHPTLTQCRMRKLAVLLHWCAAAWQNMGWHMVEATQTHHVQVHQLGNQRWFGCHVLTHAHRCITDGIKCHCKVEHCSSRAIHACTNCLCVCWVLHQLHAQLVYLCQALHGFYCW